MITYTIAGALALFLACAYLRLPLWAWTIAFGALVVSTGNLVLMAIFAVPALILNVPLIRRALKAPGSVLEARFAGRAHGRLPDSRCRACRM